jgi:hypothetical protein
VDAAAANRLSASGTQRRGGRSIAGEDRGGSTFQVNHLAPFGHRWRWEFTPLSATQTRVTETFDYRDTGALKDTVKYYERMGFAKSNAAGIEATLTGRRDRCPTT